MYFKTELLIDSSILNGCVKKWPKYQNGQNTLVLTELPVSSMGKCVCVCVCVMGGGGGGGAAQKPLSKQPKFLKLLNLVHLRNYFIEALNKFLMCFEIMG